MSNPERQTHSLRTHLYCGLSFIGLAFVVVAVGLRSVVKGRIQAQANAQVLSLRRCWNQQALLLVLMNEEVGLRSFLGTGSYTFLTSYFMSRSAEEDAIRGTLDSLQESTHEAVRERIDQLLSRIQDWHDKVAMPLIQAREKGPLPDPRSALVQEKEWFDTVTAAIAFLGSDLDAQDIRHHQDLDRTLRLAEEIEWVTTGGMIVLGLILTRWVLRKVAEPLSYLAERARTREGFPESWTRRTVKEVDILGRTLYELELKNREREQILQTAHEEDLAAKAYVEAVQHLSKEEDLLAIFVQALERHLQTTCQRILLRPVAGEGLVALFPPMPPGEAADHSILARADFCRAMNQGAPVCLRSEDPIACICPPGMPRQGACLCIPLLASGQILGLANLQAGDPDHWTPERRRLGETLVATTATALQAIRALNQAQERSLRDGLTGIYNRAFLNEFLPNIANQAKRKGFPFSLLMLDIDHFKRFNDQFGHEAGDHVLRAFAQCLQENVRSGDVVARYGGEEFAVLLPHAGLDLAMALAERLRKAVQDLPLPCPPFPLGCRITTSIGVASFPDHSQNKDNLTPLADQALYKAKDCGRNCVFSAGDLSSGVRDLELPA